MSAASVAFHNVTNVTSAVAHFGPDSDYKSEHKFSRILITATDDEGKELEVSLFFSEGVEAKIEAA